MAKTLHLYLMEKDAEEAPWTVPTTAALLGPLSGLIAAKHAKKGTKLRVGADVALGSIAGGVAASIPGAIIATLANKSYRGRTSALLAALGSAYGAKKGYEYATK